MVGWVTDQNWWHQDHPTLRFRFQVSMSGVLGVGGDLVRWSDEERKEAARLIALYKQIRPLVQQGVVHRLASPFEGERVALEYVAADGSEAVVFQYNLRECLAGSQPSARLSPSIACEVGSAGRLLGPGRLEKDDAAAVFSQTVAGRFIGQQLAQLPGHASVEIELVKPGAGRSFCRWIQSRTAGLAASSSH